jgi:hypothetical protein
MQAEAKRRRNDPVKGRGPHGGFTPSSDYFDETGQFLPGIEVCPFVSLVQISQAPEFLALNPNQVLVIWIPPADGAVFSK